ncbi:MAG: hypothetical protein AABX38_00960 [Candidatus Micrarchaeota archaeon]
MIWSKKGQVSIELLVIVATVLLIFVPLLVSVYFKANEANASIESYKAQLGVSRIANLVNSIGNLGDGSFIIAQVYVPKNTKQIKFLSSGNGGEVVFVLDSGGQSIDYAESVKYPVIGSTINTPYEGVILLNITSVNNQVSVRKI